MNSSPPDQYNNTGSVNGCHGYSRRRKWEALHPPNWKCLRWSSIKACLPGYVGLHYPRRDGQRGGGVGTGSCNTKESMEIIQHFNRASKVSRPSLDVLHLTVGGGSEAEASNAWWVQWRLTAKKKKEGKKGKKIWFVFEICGELKGHLEERMLENKMENGNFQPAPRQ